MARSKSRKGRGRLKGLAWLLGGGVVLVATLMVAAELLDAPAGAEPARSLEAGEIPEPPAAWDRVRVEVLNAGGVPGMAAAARDLLRDAGFDVVHYGNAGSFGAEETVVLARTGEVEVARRVALALGVQGIRDEPDSMRFADISVLLGSSWSAPERGDRWAGEAAGEGQGAGKGLVRSLFETFRR